MNGIVIATNGQEQMNLEDFLLWEWEGGKGTYESGRKNEAPTWEELPLENKMVYMANSFYGDMLSDNWRLEVVQKGENHD